MVNIKIFMSLFIHLSGSNIILISALTIIDFFQKDKMSVEGQQVSVEEFSERFEVQGHIIDPFERYFNIGTNRMTGRRVVIKAYYVNSQEQQSAIIENLSNYSSLRRIDGLCSLICYTKIGGEEIDVAFDFHKQTLDQFFRDRSEQGKDYFFFVKLLEGVSKALFDLKQQEVEVDDIRLSNILVDYDNGELLFRIFYDERQKNKCLSLDNLYLSPERLEEWNTGNFGAHYFEDKIVFECGLLLLDLMTYECQESFYHSAEQLNIKTIEKKLSILQQKYPSKQLTRLVARMLSLDPGQRPNLEQILHQCSTLQQSRAASKSGTKSIPRSASKSASHSGFIESPSNYTHTKQSMNGTRVFSDLDFIHVNPNTHPDAIQQLYKIKNKIDHLQFQCKRYQDGSVYYGELLGSIRQGAGIYTYSHGDIFFGNWMNNSAMLGTYIFQSGQTYQGSVRNGKHGKGLYRYANGNVYDGFWENDLKQGRGEMKYSNGDRYDGAWTRGKKHGLGVYQYSNGIRYQGNFNQGFKNGRCIIVFSDKTRFQGNWQDSCVEGLGKMMYENGDQYEGYYQQSMKTGNGIFKWANKIIYQGQFSQDTLSGRCLVHYPNKQIYEGFISDGVKNGQGMYQYQNGDSFRGIWRNDQKWQGQYSFYDGSVFQGQFRDNVIFQGRMVYQNGDTYEGEFKYGQRDGIGKYVSTSKQVIEGEWRADSFVKSS